MFGVRTCHELICMFLVYHSSKKSSVCKCIQAIYSLPVMCEGTGAGLKWFCSERRDGHASYNVETGPSDQLIHADQDTSSKLVPFGLYLPWLPIYVLIKSFKCCYCTYLNYFLWQSVPYTPHPLNEDVLPHVPINTFPSHPLIPQIKDYAFTLSFLSWFCTPL